MGVVVSDVDEWLTAEREYQKKQVAGALADAMLSQQSPLVVAGPDLMAMADRMVATGVRHGSDWVSVEDAAVIPQWVTKGLEDHAVEPPVIVSEGALPVEGVAKVMSFSELRL